MGFPTKNDHFGVFGGYHHLGKHPYVWRGLKFRRKEVNMTLIPQTNDWWTLKICPGWAPERSPCIVHIYFQVTSDMREPFLRCFLQNISSPHNNSKQQASQGVDGSHWPINIDSLNSKCLFSVLQGYINSISRQTRQYCPWSELQSSFWKVYA